MDNQLAQQPERTYHAVSTIAKARTMYVVKGVKRQEIADKLKVPACTVSTWINRGGWIEERNKRLERIEAKAVTNAQSEHDSFLASVSAQVEELTEDSLSMARDAVDNGLKSARELQQASQSAKNFVDIYFKANRLDAANSSVTINAESLVFRLPEETTKAVKAVNEPDQSESSENKTLTY